MKESQDHELMRLHIEALFKHDDAGRMLRVNEPGGAPAPRFFLGRTADGSVLRFRHDVGDDLRRELEAAAAEDVALRGKAARSPVDPARYEAILARFAPVERTETGPAFCFPRELPAADGTVRVTEANAHLLHPLLTPWTPDVQHSQPLMVLPVDGEAVAVCGSVRRTAGAHEAGVETVPAFRGRGYAARVVAGWARAVRDLDRVPLYSTSWENTASRSVAAKLGLVEFGQDFHVT